MDEKIELETLELPNSVLIHIQQIVKQNSSLSSQYAKELGTVLTTLAVLPFKDKIQRESFFDKIQSLQGYHIVEIFNVGVTPRQKSARESSVQILQDVAKLFDICASFCYSREVPMRVSFDLYLSALKFCFPSDNEQSLPITVVSLLLELVQTFQHRRIKAELKSSANFEMFGRFDVTTSDFFEKILDLFERWRHDGYLLEIISQTVRLATADEKLAIKLVEDETLQGKQTLSSFLLVKWMKLLELANVSSGFAVALAEIDLSGKKIEPFFSGRGRFQLYDFPYQSTISYYYGVLKEIHINSSDFRIPHDKERMKIFFSHISHFCVHPNIASQSLQLLGAKSISNEVLGHILEVLFQKNGKESDFFEKVVEHVLKVSVLRSGGELLKEILNFWRGAFPDDPNHDALVCLLALFEEVEEDSNNEGEVPKRIFNFLERLPRPLLLLLPFWQNIFGCLIKLIPKSIDSHPEVLALIQKAAALVLQLPQEQRQSHFAINKLTNVKFFEWFCEQDSTEEAKSEMIFLFASITHSATASHRLATTLDTSVLTSLHFCKQLSFSSKLNVVRELTSLDHRLQELDQEALKLSIERIASSPECTDNTFCEIFALVKKFVDGKGPKNTAGVFFDTLLLLWTVPISNDRRLNVIRNLWNNESETGFKSSRYILDLLESHADVLKEGGNEYFDLLVHVIVETFKSDFGLCDQLFRALKSPFQFSSSFVLNVWTSVVAELISSGLFDKEIDLFCCLPVLRKSQGFDSPLEIRQLLDVARSTAVTLSRRNLEANLRSGAQASSQACSIRGNNRLGNFVNATTTILDTDMLSSMQKMQLVSKVGDFLLCTTDICTALIPALKRLIPYISGTRSNLPGSYEIQAKMDRIIAILSDPKLVNELSRIPQALKTDDLFQAVSKNMSDVSSELKSVEVLLFISSMQDLVEGLFMHLLPFVKRTIDRFSSVEDVLEVLKELVHLLRKVHTKLIPFMFINFAYFIEKPVEKQERDKFLLEIAMRWKASLSYEVLSFLEVPRLLWKAYNTTSAPSKRGELIGRLQEIISRNETSRHEWVLNENHCQFLVAVFDKFFGQQETAFISKRIACCELEWLIFHSPLSNKDAALAFDLSYLFSRTQGYRQRSLFLSDVRIENGVFKFYRGKTAPEVLNGSTYTTSVVEEGSTSSNVETQEAVLIPVLMAQKLITCLTGLLGPMENLAENVRSVWKLVCEAQQQVKSEVRFCCNFFFDDYQEIFESILTEASSKEIVFLWASQNPHHAVQCSEVILSACRWHGKEMKDTDNEAFFKFQILVSTTLDKIRSSHLRCFRNLESSLKYLNTILECRWPIEVRTRALELYQVDRQAGVSITEIVSSWSSFEQSLTLLEKVRSYYEAGEMIPSDSAEADFVWQLLKSSVRYGMINSCGGVLAIYEQLLDLHDSEDPFGFNRLCTWRKAMMESGDCTVRSIDSWCVAFLKTPLGDLKSRDVDAIASLDFDALQLVAPVSEKIKTVIFPAGGFEVTEGEGIKSSSIKERIRLAKLIGDFISILRLLKLNENLKANVTYIVVGACSELCTNCEGGRNRGDLYKIQGQTLKSIFTEIFLSKKASGNCVLANQEDKESSAREASARQPCHLQESPTPFVLRNNEFLDPVLEPLLRRWLLGIVGKKPILASLTLEILQLLPSDVDLALCSKFQTDIQARILSFKRNQLLMAQLQAVGFNRREEDDPDLWFSPAIELSCYLSKRESSSHRTFCKKLTEVLRFHWNGWKDLLFDCNVDSVEVGGVVVRTKDLFGFQASLEEMEKQVAAVKEWSRKLASGPLKPETFNSSGGIDGSIAYLIRRENQHRRRIAKMYDRPSVSRISLLAINISNLKTWISS